MFQSILLHNSNFILYLVQNTTGIIPTRHNVRATLEEVVVDGSHSETAIMENE